MPADNLHTLDNEDRKYLRAIVEKHGLEGAARLLNISRGVVSSAVGAIGVRRGSIELIRDALAAHKRTQVS
jgi:hypothetical protein